MVLEIHQGTSCNFSITSSAQTMHYWACARLPHQNHNWITFISSMYPVEVSQIFIYLFFFGLAKWFDFHGKCQRYLWTCRRKTGRTFDNMKRDNNKFDFRTDNQYLVKTARKRSPPMNMYCHKHLSHCVCMRTVGVWLGHMKGCIYAEKQILSTLTDTCCKIYWAFPHSRANITH